MTATVIRADAAALPLRDASIDLVVTSPPYFAQRSYTDGGEHYDGQIGDETTPTAYLDALIACTAEWMRVLKPGGSIFVNLGDKYSQYEGIRKGHGRSIGRLERTHRGEPLVMPVGAPGLWGVAPKSLMGMPWRYALRCIDELGLILRAEVVWSKPNGLPESVTDRVRRSHEQVFHLVKRPRYYSAVDEVRQPHTWQPSPGYRGHKAAREVSGQPSHFGSDAGAPGTQNPLGNLPGSVWTIPTAPLTVPAELGVDHFAAYPPELVRRIVLGWSPREVCTACGEGRRPVVAKPGLLGGDNNPYSRDGSRTRSELDGGQMRWAQRMARPDYITGYACACPDTTAPATPGVVLDPFGGTGTTALVADVHGRIGISVDLSADYCRLAHWRTTDPGERARVLGVPKPARPVDGQLTFEGLA